MSEPNNLGSYLKKLNDTYSNKEKSITDILTSFSQITPDYNELNEVNENVKETQYSSNNYCRLCR